MESGKLTAAIGSSRSGKSQFVHHNTDKARRLLVWDIKGEFPNCHQVRTRAQLVALLKRADGKVGRIAYVAPTLEDFTFFCKAAQLWVRGQFAAGHKSVLVFEETSDVTNPGKAPAEYGIILRRYLAYGVDIYAVTQRPAESDKTAVGNASMLHVCRLSLADDRRSVARNTGLPLEALEALRADQDAGRFDFLQADTGRGKWQQGRLTFPGGRRKFSAEGGEQDL